MYVFPVAFRIGALPITWRGLVMALAVIAALALALRDERWMGFPEGTALRFAAIALPCCFVGARLFFLAFSWDRFAGRPTLAIDVLGGGFALYGAILAGGIAGLVFARREGLEVDRFFEWWATPLVLAIAVGRFGDLANLESYGAEVTSEAFQRFPFAVFVTRLGEWRLALFFFEALACLLVFAYLLFRRAEFPHRGDAMAMALLFYGGLRCAIESFREDSLYVGFVRVSQVIGLVSVIAVTALYWRRAWKLRPQLSVLLFCIGLDAVLLGLAFYCEFRMAQQNWLRNHVLLIEAVAGMVAIALAGHWNASGRPARSRAAMEAE